VTGRNAPKRLGRPPAIDSAETRQKILDAARRSFARRGYDATTNKDIAEEVGITTGAIYHYFASKADLYVAVHEEVQTMIYNVFEKAIIPYATFAERIAAALDAAVEINQRDWSIAGFVVTVPDERARHGVLNDRLGQQRHRRRAFFGRLVEDAVDRGEIAPDIDPVAVTDALTAVTSGLARFSTLASTERHRQAADALKRMFDGSLVLSPAAERRATTVP
jgi:AcrR family transcriptional regulator